MQTPDEEFVNMLNKEQFNLKTLRLNSDLTKLVQFYKRE